MWPLRPKTASIDSFRIENKVCSFESHKILHFDVMSWSIWPWPGNPYWMGSLSTVDLLVLTSLCLMLWIHHTLFTFFTIFILLSLFTILMRRSTVLSLPLQPVFPALADIPTQVQSLWVRQFQTGSVPHSVSPVTEVALSLRHILYIKLKMFLK
jgi:hypothetical protein